MLKKMFQEYNKKAFTHHYILGFYKDGQVFMVKATSRTVSKVLKLDKASRGGGCSLRFRPNKKQKELLLKKACVLCSKDFFNEQVKNSKYNKGEIFEKLITEKCGQEWKKDNIPFTKAGDLKVNGISYQIKFEKATFITEKALQGLNKKPLQGKVRKNKKRFSSKG